MVARNRQRLTFRRPALDLLGRGLSNPFRPEYLTLELGVGGNRTACLATRGDNDPLDATSIAGAYNKHPRQGFVPDKVCANGDIVVFFQGMDTNSHDYGVHSILMVRSTDGGRTFGSPTTVYRLTASTTPAFTNRTNYLFTGCCVIDAATGRMHLNFTLNQNGGGADTPATTGDVRAMHTHSDDNGLTWSVPVDISSSVKKTASNQTLPWDATAAPWGWIVFGPGSGCQLTRGAHAGRIVMPAVHRYTTNNSGKSFIHFVASDDNGESWYILGGPRETTHDDLLNETACAEYGEGEVYALCRQVSGSNHYAIRSLSGGGSVWGDAIAQDGVTLSFDGATPTTLLRGNACQTSLCRTPDGTLYALFPHDTTLRSNGRLWKSTNGGVTWDDARYLNRYPFGYSGLLAVDNGSILALFENTVDYAGAVSDSTVWYQRLDVLRVPTSYVTSTPSEGFEFSHWLFNEAASGAISTKGCRVRDHGTHRGHAKGGAGGSYIATGLRTNGTNRAVVLAEKTTSLLGNYCDPLLDSLTIELVGLVMASNTTKRVIIDGRNDTGQGWTFNATTGHKPRVVFAGASNSVTHDGTGADDLDDGAPHDWVLVLDRSNDTLKLYKDGVQQGATMNATGALGSIVNSQACCLGAQINGGSDSNPAAFDLRELRITRGVLPQSEWLSSSATKETLDELEGYVAPAVAATRPDQISGLELWLARTDDGCRGGGGDRFGGWDKRELPVPLGRGISFYNDHVRAMPWRAYGESVNRGLWIANAAEVGRFYRLSYQGTGGGYLRTLLADCGTTYDFMHNTGAFTITMAIKWFSGGTGPIWDQTLNAQATNGFYWQRSSTTGSACRLSQNNVNLINSSVTRTLANGVWYFLCFRAHGGTTAAELFSAAYTTAPAAPAIGSPATFGTTVAPSGTHASTRNPTIGARSDDSVNMDMGLKNFCIYNRALLDAEVQTVCNFNSAA